MICFVCGHLIPILFLKRFFDVAFSLFFLLVFGIPMILVAALIKLETTGPAIFVQQRVGLGGVSFAYV